MSKGRFNLKWELTQLCKSLHPVAIKARLEGFATQKNRADILRQCAQQLKAGGFINMKASSLKPKHIEYLVQHWQAENVSTGTIKNRMSALRWWAEKVGKKDVVAKDNEFYGIAKRNLVGGAEGKARELDQEKLAQIKDPSIRMALEVQRAFGMRMAEAILLHPKSAFDEKVLRLKGSTCKGGREREIPITNQTQVELLNRLIATVGNGYLIPKDRNYKQQKNIYKAECARVKLDRNHGLRHRFARDLYTELSGRLCPADGGFSRKEMTKEERKKDDDVRQVVSRALGHERISITSIYLGV